MTNKNTLFLIVAMAILSGSFLTQAVAQDAESDSIDIESLVEDELFTTQKQVDRAIAALPFEVIKVAGEDAVAEWAERRTEDGVTPIVVGSSNDLTTLAEAYLIEENGGQKKQSTQYLLSRAELTHFPKDYENLMVIPEPTRSGNTDVIALAPAPFELPQTFLASVDLISGEPLDEVYIALLPTDSAAEAPAYFRYGGWNAYPPAEHHVAALASWNRRYDAEIVAMTSDTVELLVPKLPTSRTEAMALAREIYLYCPDAIDQGAGSLEALATQLMQDHHWVFWWD